MWAQVDFDKVRQFLESRAQIVSRACRKAHRRSHRCRPPPVGRPPPVAAPHPRRRRWHPKSKGQTRARRHRLNHEPRHRGAATSVSWLPHAGSVFQPSAAAALRSGGVSWLHALSSAGRFAGVTSAIISRSSSISFVKPRCCCIILSLSSPPHHRHGHGHRQQRVYIAVMRLVVRWPTHPGGNEGMPEVCCVGELCATSNILKRVIWGAGEELERSIRGGSTPHCARQ